LFINKRHFWRYITYFILVGEILFSVPRAVRKKIELICQWYFLSSFPLCYNFHKSCVIEWKGRDKENQVVWSDVTDVWWNNQIIKRTYKMELLHFYYSRSSWQLQ
jgi:hypothetical protein